MDVMTTFVVVVVTRVAVTVDVTVDIREKGVGVDIVAVAAPPLFLIPIQDPTTIRFPTPIPTPLIP